MSQGAPRHPMHHREHGLYATSITDVLNDGKPTRGWICALGRAANNAARRLEERSEQRVKFFPRQR